MKLLHPENIDFHSIRNIIFDWGGVITNIDYQRTIDAFENLGIPNFKGYFSKQVQNNLFRKYETGSVSSDELRLSLMGAVKPGTTIGQIDDAWCAMLLDTPLENIEIVIDFASCFKIFLLSNTNEIHANMYNKHLKNDLDVDFPSLFNKIYYSHVVGKRKPNRDIFEHVLADSDLDPSETLFIDDTEMHVNGAADTGIVALHLHDGLTLKDIYKIWKGLK
ncbi:MAG: HAD family phosphatase [Bacteroidales bacterium]|nr:HAD family phosphatase [Bacteroidales bacterium]